MPPNRRPGKVEQAQIRGGVRIEKGSSRVSILPSSGTQNHGTPLRGPWCELYRVLHANEVSRKALRV